MYRSLYCILPNAELSQALLTLLLSLPMSSSLLILVVLCLLLCIFVSTQISIMCDIISNVAGLISVFFLFLEHIFFFYFTVCDILLRC